MARHDGNALDRLQALQCRNGREPGSAARGDPAAVDEDVEIAALERKRRQHVIAGDAAQHLVVEEERCARDEAAARAHAPALEFDRNDPRGRDRKNGLAVGLLDLARKLELLLRPPRLPVAERHGERDERRGRDASREPRAEYALTDADPIHGFTRSTLGAGCRAVKIVVILLFVAILASLGSALFFLVTDRGQSKRTVEALAVRAGLSPTLFLPPMARSYLGLIPGKIER